MRFSVNTKQQINPFSLYTYRDGTGGYVVGDAGWCTLFPQVCRGKKNKMKRKKSNYKKRRQRKVFNFFMQSQTHQQSAAQRLSRHSQGKIKNKRELVSLFDAEGPNVPFKVAFVLFLPGKNDFPFKPLVGKVE